MLLANAGKNSEKQDHSDIVGGNVKWFSHDIALMAESKAELKRLLTRVKEKSERAGLKLNIKKTKIMASGPIIHSK